MCEGVLAITHVCVLGFGFCVSVGGGAYVSTWSTLFIIGASATERLGYVQMPGTPRRTVVGGVLARGPCTHELRRSVEHPSKLVRPFQQIGKTPPAREYPLL